jgi:hypothetical protein
MDTEGHIHGVLPIGVCIARGDTNIRDTGLGTLGHLPDELLVDILDRLTAQDLVRLSAASRCSYVFCNNEDLWKALTMQVRPVWGALSSVLTTSAQRQNACGSNRM